MTITDNDTPLRQRIQRQRATLHNMLVDPMRRVARRCATVWDDRAALDHVLAESIPKVPYVTYLYALDLDARAERQAVDAERAARRLVAEERHVDLVHCGPLGDVGEEHRALYDVVHRRTVGFERRLDGLERLLRLRTNAPLDERPGLAVIA